MRKQLIPSILILICYSSFAQLKPKDTIRKIEIFFKTSNEILSGTDNDVWFDIGPKAWRISDGFEKGSLKKVTIENPSRLTFGVDGYEEAEEVPLLVEDIKIIRIEKKGIRPCELLPNLPAEIAGKCADLGGLSNAPDSKFQLVSIDEATPAGQVRRLKSDIGTAEAVLIQAQGALNKAQAEYNKIVDDISGLQSKIASLKKTVSKIPPEAIGLFNQLQASKQKLISDKIAETVTDVVCDDHKVWKIVKIGLLGPVGAWVTERICHNIQKINPLYQAATAHIQELQTQLTSKAGEVGANTLDELSKQEAKLTDLKNSKIAVEVTLSQLRPILNDQRILLAKLKDELHELELFIREKLPFLNFDFIPNVNQWKLESIAVLINGKNFRSYYINKRFKQGSSSKTINVTEESAELNFLNKLRVNKNKGNTGDGISAALTSPLFKERQISGWDDEPLGYGTAVGTLVNPPNKGADGFVSLDLKIDAFYVGAKRFVLDGKHGVNHSRYIRCEYLRVKPDNTVDDNFNNLSVGQKVKISGKIFRDLDRQTFFELHPVFSSEIKILN